MDDEEKAVKIKDYTKHVEERIPDILGRLGSNAITLNAALEELLALEKKTRLAADADSTTVVASALLKLLRERSDWAAINQHITLLCTRRAQLTKVLMTVVKTAFGWLAETPDDETKRKLIDTIRTVSAGKIVVELEHARTTRILSQMHEREGKLNEAGDLLQEVQVETIGSMEMREKADFLLEQLRLCLVRQDRVRAEMVARKVNIKVLQRDDMQDLKLRFNELMIRLHTMNSNFLEICRCYRNMFDTPSVQADREQWTRMLRRVVMFAVLAEFDSEVSDILHRLKTEKKLVHLPTEKHALELFTADELIHWPLKCQDEWLADEVFAGEDGRKRWNETVHKRVVQHNIRTISKFYERITWKRLAELIVLPMDKTEEFLSGMVTSGQLYAKMDRPAGMVSFKQPVEPDAEVDEWVQGVGDLLNLVEKTCHLINKENMLHGRARAAE